MNEGGDDLGMGDVETVRTIGLWSEERSSSLEMEQCNDPRPLCRKKSRRSGLRLGSVGQYVGVLGERMLLRWELSADSNVRPREFVDLAPHCWCFAFKSAPRMKWCPKEFRKEIIWDSEMGILGGEYAATNVIG